ncbi:lytic transglycosylase domain-containing protein [Hyphomicrobium facile]|uniref:Soluble lytic murein transglycosylase n=1 Tax=Hyphomicrobium facile TaxID=51670 RepID=A0A1I7N1S0_9HYPH|nr:lytic transglycosylase domain-containing protein [Hyphomicrobium facile]SFV28573.1 soluble lytic murein transglycosylase [Hyphomicrobium facile]
MHLTPNHTILIRSLPRALPKFAAAVAILGFALASAPARAESAQKPVPAPQLLPAEKDQLRKFDAALAPLLSISPDSADVEALRQAIAAVRANDIGRFMEAKEKINDPVVRKLADWIRLRAGLGEPPEFQKFLKDNPAWPDRPTLTQRFEEALFTHGGTAKTIKSYFPNTLPETGAGYAALASANLADGKTEEARKLAAQAWREMSIPPSLENGFLDRFGSLLSPADHKWRFDRLVTDDVRYAGNRADRVALAHRLIPLLPESERKRATARLAVFNRASNAQALMNALPPGSRDDTGLAFHKAQLLRKAGKTEEAAAIILAIPPNPDKIAALDEWWAERRELAYGALKLGNAKLAYDLVKDAGPLSVNPRKDQTFLAGWIAFRYLNKADVAQRHFKDMATAADGPLSRAKAAYWLGRVADARGDKPEALKQYRAAAKNPDTFHGLLSMQMLEPNRSSLEMSPPAYPAADQIQKLLSSDAARALVIARKANLQREITRTLLAGLRNSANTEAEVAMVAYLADALGDPQMSLRISKVAIGKGQNLLTYGYPLKPFPGYAPLRAPPELPLLLGIARQETEFDPQTVSGAGAKGLLQVMTPTAHHVCRDYKIKCSIPRLLSDPPYNVMIASAYIADRMDDFGGSYVLGLAGYNAGPGRARQWIRENGDPRDPNVDTIDWIERIPITETREYVTKVLANIQIYRARLGMKNPLRLKQDLLRDRGDTKVPGDTQGVAENNDG